MSMLIEHPTPASPPTGPSPAGGPSQDTRHVPGEIGVWCFVLADMAVFAIFFVVFLLARADNPELFAASRADVNEALGALNMIVLLTSSAVVAFAVEAARIGERARASKLFTAGAVLGGVFLAVKAIEYAQKLGSGIDPGTNDFFLYFFLFTGIHAVHVALGIAFLLALRWCVCRPSPGEHEMRTVESGATFWHMVDLLWVVLFPLLYLAS